MSSGDDFGRQILSYWTTERMLSAVPEPGLDLTTTSAHSAQVILDYWTPERMATARPEEHAYGEHIKTVEGAAIRCDRSAVQRVQGAASMTIVPDSKVKTFPFQSVGKLFYVKVGPSGESESFASAWVANASSELHVVMTAAHCLERDDNRAEKIFFVPGFIPPCFRPFGSYPQIPGGKGEAWIVDPNWDPNDMQAKYDLGMVRLEKDRDIGKYVNEVVLPIQVSIHQQYTPISEWNTIGYPVASSQNPDGKMAEQSGTFCRMSCDGGSFYKYGTLPKGTNGGPWILDGSNDSSSGVQTGNDCDYQCALSPYLTQNHLEEMIKLFKFMTYTE
ncbi:uncharacterized protein [Montipora capricornis]|uniref:uncharacterized protein n=1 Tax=Montipora capricornis TaxID=246305 RepID=UPI0035F1E24F